jgi:hypothetical protein
MLLTGSVAVVTSLLPEFQYLGASDLISVESCNRIVLPGLIRDLVLRQSSVYLFMIEARK